MASQGREVYSLISTEGVRPLQGLRFRASQPLTGTNLLGFSPSHGTIFIKKKVSVLATSVHFQLISSRNPLKHILVIFIVRRCHYKTDLFL